MNGSRPTPSRRGETSSLDALNRTIEGLEARIEGLMHSSGRDARQATNPGEFSREQRQTAAPSPTVHTRDPATLNPLDEIRQRQRALDAARHGGQQVGREIRPPEAQAYADVRATLASRRPSQPIQDSRYPDPRPPLPHPVAERPAVARPALDRQVLRTGNQPLPAPAAPVATIPASMMNDIAEALISLRQDLKQDISQGVAREMDGLRTEIRSIRAIAEDNHFADDLRGDLARLSDSISNMGQHGVPESESLRSEFEELRVAMGGLAREDTVQRMGHQVQGLEDRVIDADPRVLREELVALAYRIDGIKTQLGSVGDNPAIMALEDKLLTLASAVEQLGTRMVPQHDPVIVEQFSMLDLRLDEISRALAASSRASAAATMDQGLIGRLEQRLDGLADQIDAMHRDTLQTAIPVANPGDDEMGLRMEALARKIDDFSREQGAMRLDERLEDLAILMERVQQPAPPAELTGYLSDISRKIDALEQGSVNDMLAERLDYLSRRIEEIEIAPVLPVDNDMFGRLEGRLSDIAARLDDAATAPATDTDALRNLEDQIANLSRLISDPKPAAVVQFPAEFEDRMTAIEGYMATSDEYVIEAARQAAEAVVEAYARNGAAAAANGGPMPDISALTGLAEDLRHLEDLTRGSEERTHQTFEMLHRTLVNIADRLDTMEGTISRQHAAPAAYEPARPATTPRPTGPMASATAAAPMPKAAMPMFAGGDDLHTSVAMPTNSRADDRLDERALFSEDLEHGLLDAGDVHDDLDGAQRSAENDIRTAVTQKSRTSLLGGLSRFLPGKKVQTRKNPPKNQARAVVQPTPSIDAADMLLPEQQNEPLEPGSGMPDVKKILERVRASQAGMAGNAAATDGEQVDYIAAARRAAKAAAQETDPSLGVAAGARGKKATVQSGRTAALKAKTAGGTSGIGGAFSKHRRPIMMAVGAILLALMALPLVKTLTQGESVMPTPPEIGMQGEQPSNGPVNAPQSDIGQSADTAAPEMPAAPQAAAPVDDIPPSAPVPEVTQTPLASSEPTTAAPETPATPQAAARQGNIEVPATIGPKSLADAAAAEDPQALFEIASRYADGRGGVAANLSEAARWYQLAADRGLAPAQYRIANLYEKGTGVEPDLARAATYYEQAANAGNASAMHNLAVLYASGATGTPDYAKAVSWFEKAADLGVSDSQFNLAILYARGNGVPQNLDASYKWFAIAARDGDQDAAQKRDEVANSMRPAQLEAAKAQVDLWKAKTVDPTANSVNLPDEWVGKGEKTASVDMEKAIRNIQAILNKNGFDAGQPDGKMGEKTTNAIRAFQKANGLTEDGKVSEPLVRKLLARNG